MLVEFTKHFCGWASQGEYVEFAKGETAELPEALFAAATEQNCFKEVKARKEKGINISPKNKAVNAEENK